MAAYRRVYDSRHLQADCQEPGSALECYAGVWAAFSLSSVSGGRVCVEGPFDNTDSVHIRVLQTIYLQLTGARLDCPRYGDHWQLIGFQGYYY